MRMNITPRELKNLQNVCRFEQGRTKRLIMWGVLRPPDQRKYLKKLNLSQQHLQWYVLTKLREQSNHLNDIYQCKFDDGIRNWFDQFKIFLANPQRYDNLVSFWIFEAFSILITVLIIITLSYR